jgi:hypothetical protein
MTKILNAVDLTMLLFLVMMDIMVMVESATGPIGWALNVLNFGLAAGFGAWAYSLKTPKGPLKDGFAVVR